MKIRHGFVSNSSSSSFIVIGKKIPFKSIKIDEKRKFLAIGKSLCDEGKNVFDIGEREFALIKENRFESLFEYWETYFRGNGTVDPSRWPVGKVEVFICEADNCSGLDDEIVKILKHEENEDEDSSWIR